MKIKVYLSILAIASGLCARGVCLLECDEDGVPYPCEVKGLEWIYRATGTNFPSKVLPQGSLSVTAKFRCSGLEFEASSVTNAISAQSQALIDRKQEVGVNVQIGGTHVCMVKMTKSGRHFATALLYEERSRRHAREVAIRDFFAKSSMMPEAIAGSIDIRFGEVGDYSFSWKPYGVKTDYLTFVRGGVAVIVHGVNAALDAAKAIDALLLESARLSEDGYVVNIADAATRMDECDSAGEPLAERKDKRDDTCVALSGGSGAVDASKPPAPKPEKVAATNATERAERK